MLEEKRTASLSRAHGERLRAALIGSLQGVVDSNRFKAPGSIFDSEVPYSSVHEDMVRLAELWGEADGDKEAVGDEDAAEELLELALADLIRQQKLVFRRRNNCTKYI